MTVTRSRRRPSFGWIVVLGLAVLWLAISGLPFLFMVMSGSKGQFELLSAPVWAMPKDASLQNFQTVLAGTFLQALLNSVLVVGVSLVLVLLIASMAAYVFARIEFRGRGVVFGLILAGLVIPVHITLIPTYVLMVETGLYDSIWALVGPYVAFNLPLAVFVLTEYMRRLPREVEESARVDGCSTAGIYWRIVLPLSGPGMATVAIFTAVAMWNEFVFAYVLTASPGARTLPLSIWDYQGQYTSNIPLIMAVLTLASLPLVVAYVIGQERVVSGITAGAVKG